MATIRELWFSTCTLLKTRVVRRTGVAERCSFVVQLGFVCCVLLINGANLIQLERLFPNGSGRYFFGVAP